MKRCVPDHHESWSAGANLPSVGVRLVGVYFPANGKFYAMGGRSSDVAGSDFTNPFEYDPSGKAAEEIRALLLWFCEKAGMLPREQVTKTASRA